MSQAARPARQLWSLKAEKLFSLQRLPDEASNVVARHVMRFAAIWHACRAVGMCAMRALLSTSPTLDGPSFAMQEHTAARQAVWKAYAKDRTEVQG